MANKYVTPTLPQDTKLMLYATHKKTGQRFEKVITYAEWLVFKKHKDYYYLTYQVIYINS